MSESDRNSAPSRKTQVFSVIWVTLVLFLMAFFVAGLMGAACRNDRFEGAVKLRYCNASLATGVAFDALGIERSKRAVIRLERGIALFQVGDQDTAREAFRRAFRDAQKGGTHWQEALGWRISSVTDKQIRDLWVSLVIEESSLRP